MVLLPTGKKKNKNKKIDFIHLYYFKRIIFLYHNLWFRMENINKMKKNEMDIIKNFIVEWLVFEPNAE